MNIYRYAGATLLLAGMIDAANRKTHKWTYNAARCPTCRERFRNGMFVWKCKQ